MKKQVYIVHYKNRLKGFTKVFAENEAAARKAAFGAYLYHGPMHNPNWSVDDVIGSAELDPDQLMGGPGIQPTAQESCCAAGSGIGLPEGKL